MGLENPVPITRKIRVGGISVVNMAKDYDSEGINVTPNVALYKDLLRFKRADGIDMVQVH